MDNIETPIPRIKRSYIGDKNLFNAANYAISLMADIPDMSTKGAVTTACSKYSVTAEELFAALGKDFKIAEQLLQEKREYRKLHPFKPKESAHNPPNSLESPENSPQSAENSHEFRAKPQNLVGNSVQSAGNSPQYHKSTPQSVFDGLSVEARSLPF